MVTQQMKGIQQPSLYSRLGKFGDDVFIGAFSYIGENVKVGNGTKIFPTPILVIMYRLATIASFIPA